MNYEAWRSQFARDDKACRALWADYMQLMAYYEEQKVELQEATKWSGSAQYLVELEDAVVRAGLEVVESKSLSGPFPLTLRKTVPAVTAIHPEVSNTTQKLIDLLVARDQAGRTKYGTTLDRTDLAFNDWLQHMAEELLDGAGYALAAKRTASPAPSEAYDAALDQLWTLVGGNSHPVYRLFLSFRGASDPSGTDEYLAYLEAAIDEAGFVVKHDGGTLGDSNFRLEPKGGGTPAAPGIDLEQFRALAKAWEAKIQESDGCRTTAGANHAYEECSDALFALIDASPKGGSEPTGVLDALVSLVAVARRYLPDYDEHPEVQKADAAIDAAIQATSAEVGRD